jgi:hypothetical protein
MKDDKFTIEGLTETGVHGTHEREGQPTEQNELQPMVEGRPLQEGEEIVRIEAVEGNTLKLKTLYAQHKGPSRASSPKYRAGYDAVFKKRDLN